MMVHFHQKPNRFVKEVSINVVHLERSLQFYCEFIGLKILSRNKQEAILSADEKAPILRLVQPTDVTAKRRGTTGLYHFALLLPSRTDLSRFLNHLLKNNFKFGAADHIVSEAIYINDPDGNGIEIYADRSSTDWTWALNEVKMTTDPLNVDELLFYIILSFYYLHERIYLDF